MRLMRSKASRPGWRSLRCRAASEGLGVAIVVSGVWYSCCRLAYPQAYDAVRSLCCRDAGRVPQERESTRRFRVVRCIATTAPGRSHAFATRLASGAAATPGQRRQDKGDGAGRSESFGKSTRQRGAQFCAACRLSRKGPQVQSSQRHRAIVQPRQSDDCASRRTFRPFPCRARPFMIRSMPLVATTIASDKAHFAGNSA
jgi:hypothetical protein